MWSLVPRASNTNVVDGKWVYKLKRDKNGAITHYKARFVAKGFQKQPGIDFQETFSPVVKSITIRVVLSLAVTNDWRLRQLHIQNAFLHGNLKEQDVNLEEDQEEDGDDGDIFYMWDIMVNDVERIRKYLTPNIPDVMDDVIQTLIPITIHTTPPDTDYVALDTKLILDDLLEEFEDEVLNVTMVYERA
nr:uncharacterized mitochondrial protein AtMg00810-like isoform X2 [Tanacetum cinerariifolium]